VTGGRYDGGEVVGAGLAKRPRNRGQRHRRRPSRRRNATDSTYICLAQHLDTVVWTLDGPLVRNAFDVGLPVKLVS